MNELHYTYFLIIILVLSFVLNPFIKKQASKNLGSNEYLLINHFLITVLVVLYASYLFYFKKCDTDCIKKMTSKEILWSIAAAVTGIIGSLVLIMLVQRDEVSFIMPNVQPIVILIGSIIGYFVFKESMGLFKTIGILLIVCGAFCINYDKYLSSK